jgi:hypothetical protein
VFNALRGKSLLWFDALPVLGVDRDNWLSFKTAFLRTYGSTRTVRTAAINFTEIKQGASEAASEYISRVIKIISDMLQMAPAVLRVPDNPWSEAMRNMAGFAALAQEDRDFHLQQLVAFGGREASYRIGMQLFIAGLKPALRTELMKSNPASMEEALNAALDAEKILLEPRRSGHPAQLASIDQEDDAANEDDDEVGAEQEEEEDAEILAVTTRLRNLKKKASQRKSKAGGGGRKPGKRQQPPQPGKQQQPPPP